MADDPDLAALRREYGDRGLAEDEAGDDPYPLFRRWYDEVTDAGLHEPNAMVVATVGADGRPSVRTVLLKGLRTPDVADGRSEAGEGFVFFTNTASRKGTDLAAEPRCALLFGWHPVERQVRVEGTAARLPEADVAAYFAARPRGSQIGAWASAQSRPVPDRAALTATYAEMEERFSGADVPVPPEWGGYLVTPESFEFWQGRPGRMHDRIRFRREADGWVRDRLAP